MVFCALPNEQGYCKGLDKGNTCLISIITLSRLSLLGLAASPEQRQQGLCP